MNKKILISTSIGLMIIFIVLMANFGLVFAARGPKSKIASLNYANIGTAVIVDDQGQTMILGLFDKMKKSTQGAADCLDILLLLPDGGIVPFGIITDSETYEDFYADVWEFAFPPAALVDEEILEIWKKGSDIYVELTDTVSIPTMGGTYELPPLSIKIESDGVPYKAEIPAGNPLPSGWTWARITQRGYDATVTLDSPSGALLALPDGTAEFNSLDIFTPPSI